MTSLPLEKTSGEPLDEVIAAAYSSAVAWRNDLLSSKGSISTRDLEAHIRANEICLGFFPDGGKAKWSIIKGSSYLEAAAHVGLTLELRCSGAICRNPEEAEAMRVVFGDGRKAV